MTRIRVERTNDEDDPMHFHVTVEEPDGSTEHDVTLDAVTRARLAGPDVRAQELVRACFRFLLDREPKEAILARFDVTVIGRYFPGYEDEIVQYLDRGA